MLPDAPGCRGDQVLNHAAGAVAEGRRHAFPLLLRRTSPAGKDRAMEEIKGKIGILSIHP